MVLFSCYHLTMILSSSVDSRVLNSGITGDLSAGFAGENRQHVIEQIIAYAGKLFYFIGFFRLRQALPPKP